MGPATVALAWSILASAQAFAATPPGPPPSTTVAVNPPSPLSGPTSADVGEVDGAVQSDAQNLYTFKNATNAPLKIAGMRGSCGCEHMALYVDGKEQTSLVLQPGQEFQALLGVRVEGQPAGNLTKTAWIYGGISGVQTLATLSLTFRVRQAVVFAPARLDLGDIPAGGSASATVIAHIDKLPDSKSVTAPDLQTDSNSVLVVKVGDPVPEVREGKSGTAVQYRVTVTNLSLLGPSGATIRTVWPGVSVTQGASSPTGVGTSGSTFALPLTYSVVGTLDVAPHMVSFGVVSKAASSTRTLLVIGKSVDDLRAMKATSASTWLQVQGISNEHPYGAGASGLLTIVLAPGAPSGPDKSLITVHAADGERVEVPVSATVGN